jgi:hypothetical protein
MLSRNILEGTYFVDVHCQGRLRLLKLGAEFIEHGQKRSGIRGLDRRVMCWLKQPILTKSTRSQVVTSRGNLVAGRVIGKTPRGQD